MLETRIPPETAGDGSDAKPHRLCDLQVGAKDKLGNIVREILWIGAHYAIYCSDKGIYVHFSDSPEMEREQRKRFTEICPELCELRYLTAEMRGWNWWSCFSVNRRHTLYEHNMAQALMLIMEDEGKTKKAKEIAQNALTMAIRRVTSDNTIRYIRACFLSGGICIVVGWLALLYLDGRADAMRWTPYLIGGMFGAVGAMFSIVTRIEAFQLKPCDESRMNYWMSAIRVIMGVISAIALLLFADTLLGDLLAKLSTSAEMKRIAAPADAKNVAVAVLGFIGGFAERMIPNVLRQTIDTLGSTAGTPVQALEKPSVNQSRGGRTADD